VALAMLMLILPVLLLQFLFVVDETEQAVVVELGRPVQVIVGNRNAEEKGRINNYFEDLLKRQGERPRVSFGPGLYFKKPLIQTVQKFDNRLLCYDSNPTDVLTKDKKHLLVDNYARWRVLNPHQFLRTVQTVNQSVSRLDDIIYSGLREVLSKYQMSQIVRTSNDALANGNPSHLEHIEVGREAIMKEVYVLCHEKAMALGIEIVDIRIKRTELPTENQQAVFARMQAERSRVSKQFRSEGNREAMVIRADTDMKVQVLLADAYKQAQILRGEGDAKAAEIYAKAYGPNIDFYRFAKSLETLEETMGTNTAVIFDTRSSVYQSLGRNASLTPAKAPLKP
jgi:membrane protease subunit HflC